MADFNNIHLNMNKLCTCDITPSLYLKVEVEGSCKTCKRIITWQVLKIQSLPNNDQVKWMFLSNIKF